MKRLFTFLICIVMVCTLLPATAFAAGEATASTMRLMKVEGTVTVKNASGKKLTFKEDMRLYNNYQITTDRKSYAYIGLDDSKAVKLDANTKVTISRQGRKLEILVEKGKIMFDVSKPLKKDETLNIRTSTMITGVRGTIGWVEIIDTSKSQLSLLEGTTLVTTTDPTSGETKTTRVEAGQALSSTVVTEETGDTIELEVLDLKTEETPGFVRTAVAEDPEMQKRIEENTDLNVEEITEKADEILQQEEQQAEEKAEEIQQELGEIATEEVDPLFEDTADPEPQPEPLPVPVPVPTPDPEPEPEPMTYVVSFEMNGHGDAIDSQTISEGDLVTKPADPTADGYTFGGWFKDEALTTAWDFTSDTVTADTTLYAKWTETPSTTYTVTFHMMGIGEQVDPQTVIEGGLVIEPTTPTAEHYSFEGWCLDIDLTIPWDFESDTVTEDITLYADWLGEPCTVTFEMNGHGEQIDPIEVHYGWLASSFETPSEEGYTFEGWYKDEALTTLWDFKNDAFLGDTTVYAKWTINSYTITFEMNGHGDAIDPQAVEHGGTVSEPTEPTAEGFTFDGWYTDTACTTEWDFTNDTVTGDITLYAKWTEIPSYTVTFDLNGYGDPIDPQTVNEGSTVSEPAEPTTEGFTFDGWYTDAACTTKWDFTNDTVTGDITLYAKWTINSYTVTFEMNGNGNAIDPQTVEHGGTVSEPTEPTADGFTFDGWYTDTACTTEWDFANDTVTGDITLYAKWTEIPSTTQLDNPTAEELTAALQEAAESDYITDVIVSNANVTLDTMTVGEGDTLTVSSGSLSVTGATAVSGTVNIESGATLTSSGTLTILSSNSLHITGTFTNNAGLVIGGTAEDGTALAGAVVIEKTGTLDNRGTITIDSTTDSTLTNNGSFKNSGSFFVTSAGDFINNGTYQEERTDAVYVMSCGSTSVSWLGALVDLTAWPDGETLMILSPGTITLPETLLTISGVTTLDLNGATIVIPEQVTSGTACLTIDENASLTVADSSTDGTGTITSASSYCTIDCVGTFTLESGTIENTSENGYFCPAIYGSGTPCSITIKGGTVSGKLHAISNMDQSGVYGDITIKGGYIDGGTCAVYNGTNSGLLLITGGTITSNGIVIASGGEYDADSNSGTLISRDTLLRLGAQYSENTSAALISGGVTLESCFLMALDPLFFDALQMELPQETGPENGYYTVDLTDKAADPTAWVLTDPTEDALLRVLNKGYVTTLVINNTDGIGTYLTQSVTIPDRKTVTLASGEIYVEEGNSLNVYGTMSISSGASLVNNGSVVIGSDDFPNGTLSKNGGTVENNGIYLDNHYLTDTNTESYIIVTNMNEAGEQNTVYCGPADGTSWKISEEYETNVTLHILDTETLYLPAALPANSLGNQSMVYVGLVFPTDTTYTVNLQPIGGTFTLGENVQLELTSVDETLLYSSTPLFNFEGLINISPNAMFSATNCTFSGSSNDQALIRIDGGSKTEMPNLNLSGCTVTQNGTAPVIELIGGYAALNNAYMDNDEIAMSVTGAGKGIVVDDNSRLEAYGLTLSADTIGLENSSMLFLTLDSCTISANTTAIVHTGSDLALTGCTVTSENGTGIENSGYLVLYGNCSVSGATGALHIRGGNVSTESGCSFRLTADASATGVYAVSIEISDETPLEECMILGTLYAKAEANLYNLSTSGDEVAENYFMFNNDGIQGPTDEYYYIVSIME